MAGLSGNPSPKVQSPKTPSPTRSPAIQEHHFAGQEEGAIRAVSFAPLNPCSSSPYCSIRHKEKVLKRGRDSTEHVNQQQDNLDNDGDADSAFGTDGTRSSTGSLTESIYEYRVLHGRTYNAPKTSEYWAPNDEQQNEGLDLMHNCLLMMMENKILLAPIGNNPHRVLDVGTGTGIWAIDFGDTYPSAEVIGTDLSPIQPSWTPPNVQFQVDDCILDWTWPEDHFDLIHMRSLYGSIPDWNEMYRKAFTHLQPGGWLECLETDVMMQSDHVEFPADHIFKQWGQAFYDVGDRSGRTFSLCCGHTMRENIERAGFVDVQEVKLKMPCHGWPRDRRLQQAGLLLFSMLDQSLEGFTMRLFTEQLGWGRDQVILFCARFRAELKRMSNCAWLNATIVYGRKPEVYTS